MNSARHTCPCRLVKYRPIYTMYIWGIEVHVSVQETHAENTWYWIARIEVCCNLYWHMMTSRYVCCWLYTYSNYATTVQAMPGMITILAITMQQYPWWCEFGDLHPRLHCWHNAAIIDDKCHQLLLQYNNLLTWALLTEYTNWSPVVTGELSSTYSMVFPCWVALAAEQAEQSWPTTSSP